MKLFLKLFGLILVILTGTAIGFLKAQKLKTREKRLLEIRLGLCELKERIRLENGELDAIVGESFSPDIVTFKENKPIVIASGISEEDKAVLDDYFRGAGMADSKAECDRVELYISLITKQLSTAQKQCGELCGLYRTVGFLGGVFLCIFLM